MGFSISTRCLFIILPDLTRVNQTKDNYTTGIY